MLVQRVPIASLSQDPANARVHPDAQLDAVLASLRRFGQQKPIVVDKHNVVRAGNGTLAAATKLGWTEIDIVRTELEGVDATAYAIADNRTTDLSSFDEAALSKLLQECDAAEMLDSTGFTERELDALIAQQSPFEEDGEAPEVQERAITQRGDVWLLGRHRVMCGDSTSATDVERVLAGTVPSLMVTDPPYGVEYDPEWRHEAGRNNSERTGKVSNDDRASWSEAWSLFPGDVAYVWHGAWYAAVVANDLIACGFDVRAQIVWAKPALVISRGHYHWQHEPCWYAVRKGRTANWIGDRSQSTLWKIDRPAKSEGETTHGTQKPVECMARPMRNHLADTVYDPFLGSGTSLVAAEQLGRSLCALELEPRYVDVCVRRWQVLTGKHAVLEGAGRTLEQAERAPLVPNGAAH